MFLWLIQFLKKIKNFKFTRTVTFSNYEFGLKKYIEMYEFRLLA